MHLTFYLNGNLKRKIIEELIGFYLSSLLGARALSSAVCRCDGAGILFCKPLATLIFASFGIAQTSLALPSLNAKIGWSVGSCGLVPIEIGMLTTVGWIFDVIINVF